MTFWSILVSVPHSWHPSTASTRQHGRYLFWITWVWTDIHAFQTPFLWLQAGSEHQGSRSQLRDIPVTRAALAALGSLYTCTSRNASCSAPPDYSLLCNCQHMRAPIGLLSLLRVSVWQVSRKLLVSRNRWQIQNSLLLELTFKNMTPLIKYNY